MVRAGTGVAGVLVALVCVGVVACRDRPAVAPSGTFAGTWTGTAIDSVAGNGTARLSIEEREAVVVGTFSTAFGGVVTREGPTQGGLVGSTLVITFAPPAPLACGGGVTLSGTLSITLTPAGSRLRGTYAGLACGGAVTGTLDLVRG